MSNWIRVKKARVLRNKLIAVMYLLFISLSVINIPIDWLHVNKYMAPLLTETTIVSIENNELRAVYEGVEAIKTEFYQELGYNEETGEYREPFGYSVTDNFFITRSRGSKLQEALQQVYTHLDELGEEKATLFNTLFEEDLKNGLLEEGDEWLVWKFKHVPASLAEVLLNEIVLRVRLISGDLEFKGHNGPISSEQGLVQFATNLDFMVLGDTLKVQPSDANTTASVQKATDEQWQDLAQEESTYHFIPEASGTYTLRLRSDRQEEFYSFTVLPARINRRGSSAVLTYVEGMPATVSVGTVIAGGKVDCSCDPAASFRNQQLNFTPANEGWCSFEVRGGNNALLLQDSVYVQRRPEPLLKVKGLLEGDRLPKGTQRLALEAVDALGELSYTIEEIHFERIQASTGEETALSDEINLGDYQGPIWIKKVIAQNGNQTIEMEGNFLITIDA